MQTIEQQRSRSRIQPGVQAMVGGGLLIAAWYCSWFGPIELGAHTFFPLWLGYILAIDAFVQIRAGSSLLSRSPGAFALLFILSAPMWWIFELVNIRLGNWHYHLPHDYSWLHYHAEASIAFSTVLPALFTTTELLATTRLGRRRFMWRAPSFDDRQVRALSAAGFAMIVLVLLFPRYCFPLVWIGFFFLIDPVNARAGRPSLSGPANRGDWTKPVLLALSGLVCGFLWEMWNTRATPKWTYDVPYVGFWKLFEMPILGYGGYIPFAFELYAAYHLVTAVLPRRWIVQLSIDQRGNCSRENDQT